MPEVLDPGDILEIHQLLALYGHLLDDGAHDRLGEIFAADAVLTFVGRDREPVHTAEAIGRFFAGVSGSSAHHTSNVVVRTPEGWRIASRSIEGRWQLTVDEGEYAEHRATF